MRHNGRSWRSRFALAADAAFLLLAGLAVFINRTGGVKWRLGTLRLTASSGARMGAAAIVVLIVRHAVVRHPSIAARLVTALQRVNRLARIPVGRLATAADMAVATLGGLAFIVDLVGGVEWRVGALRIALPSGARLALAALVVLLARRVVVRRSSSPLQRLLTRRRTTTSPWTFDWPSRREWLLASLVIGASTVVLLREQLLAFTSVPDLGDPVFPSGGSAGPPISCRSIPRTCLTPTSSTRPSARWRTPTRCCCRRCWLRRPCGSVCRLRLCTPA